MISCPICQHDDVRLKYILSNEVYQCNKCGFQFAPNATFDTTMISDQDETTRMKALKSLRVMNFEKIVASLKKQISSNHSGLEIGSGHGWFLETCKKSGIHCCGIEPETHFNDMYHEMGVDVINGFFPDALPANSKYDFIIYNDVFEHLPDVKTSMRMNQKALNPKGKLIVNIPLKSGVIYRLSELAYMFGIKNLLNRMWQFNFHSPHLSYFSKRNLIQLSDKEGFTLLESFPLKTINLSEIKDRVGEDKSSNQFIKMISIAGVYLIYPVLQLFPDTYCFIFENKH